jgi:large subunit ribosomal protein L15
MQQHQLKPRKGSTKTGKRKGIGDTFGGRGCKGQKARVGGRSKYGAGFEGGQTPIIRRLPKLGGFINVNRNAYQAVNLGDLENMEGEVNALTLKKAGLIGKANLPVKILGNGKLTKKLTIKADAASASAIVAIEKAGGKLEIIAKKAKLVKGEKKTK